VSQTTTKGQCIGKEDYEEQTRPAAVYCIRYQDAESSLESTDASIKVVEDDEAYGRFTATEGIVAWNWTRSSTVEPLLG
jgi:hypothetical protein